MTGESGLVLETDHGMAVLTIDRPQKRNALTFDMWCEIPALLERVDLDSRTFALVVRGAGGKAFSAGADIGEFPETRSTAEGARSYNDAIEAAADALLRLTKPSIAAIAGSCMGGALGLALACDFRLASTDSRFAITPAKLGMVYGFTMTKLLVNQVGPSEARYLLMTAATIDAERALRTGLVDDVVSPEGLPARVQRLVGSLAPLSQTSVRGAKFMIGRVLSGQAVDDAETRRVRADSFASADYQEGVRAFIERRDAEFRDG